MQGIRTLDFVSIIMALISSINETDLKDEPYIRIGARNAFERKSHESIYKAGYYAALADASFMVANLLERDGDKDER